MRTEFLCISVLRAASGPRVKLASCKSALNPPVVYSTDRSKAVVLVFVLLFVALWFILPGNLFYVLPCVILFLCFFSPFSIAITSLGEERANFSAFCTFVRFVLVRICRFPLPLGVWEGLRFVIVAWTFLLPFVLNSLPTACQKTEPFHTSCLRKLLKIKWQDRIPDTELLKRARMQSVHNLLKLAQFRWTGHVTRMPDERLPKNILYWELQLG